MTKIYTISQGETAYGIAKNHGLTLSQLQEANPDINLNILRIGQELNIPRKTDGPLDFKELKSRQGWTESKFDSKAESNAGAKGIYQIMSSALQDYNEANDTNYKESDLFKDRINNKIRDWIMDDLYNAPFIDKPESSDSIRYAKTLAAYNWGRGNLSNYLNEAKQKEIDIYDSWDWVPGMPKLTLNYLNFILRNLNTGAHRTNLLYNTYKQFFK